ncbi:MAG: hypothetical protein GXO39_03710 [Thermotogae bacterium]|nr:hypothetical protein [Thermotogota bacterium]
MIRGLIFSVILLGSVVPLSASYPLWIELGGGPWLPMFGQLKNDHNMGFQNRLRIGYGRPISLPGFLKSQLKAFDGLYPFVEIYHAYNTLKPEAWVIKGRDTITLGNMLYGGVGGRLENTYDTFGYGLGTSVGFLINYPVGKFSLAGFLGIYGKVKLGRAYLFTEYSIEVAPDLKSNYTTDSLINLFSKTSGWHEVSVGVGFRFP